MWFIDFQRVVSQRDLGLVKNLFKQISHQIVCSKCEEEFLAGTTDSRTLQDYTKLDVGFTESGLQVWCRRHDTNVVHIDFEGRKLKADFRCLERGDNLSG